MFHNKVFLTGLLNFWLVFGDILACGEFYCWHLSPFNTLRYWKWYKFSHIFILWLYLDNSPANYIHPLCTLRNLDLPGMPSLSPPVTLCLHTGNTCLGQGLQWITNIINQQQSVFPTCDLPRFELWSMHVSACLAIIPSYLEIRIFYCKTYKNKSLNTHKHMLY